MQIVLQRKLGIKAVNLIVHMIRENDDRVWSRSYSSIGRKSHPNPRTQCGSNAFPDPQKKNRLMHGGESNEAPKIVEAVMKMMSLR